ncbi:cyclin N-terminal domain-containing protein 1 isoform X3 [Fukomys damarensis]|uniref:cyclin N-terminal domain-containing protein 1 isoform X3 n=1 Tax=Fukomys damarensis TaxID=885580 RepID=UPI0005400654|nr:cyclin N-terminal domain-containing protein 1 isoform X3 [Fukomys damarensis]
MDRAARPRSASLGDFQFGAVATETIEDALLYLARRNEQAVREATGQQGHFRFREPVLAEFVFLLSEQWCLEKSVRYQAVEILERFMVKQAEDICAQATVQLGDSEWTEAPNWRVRKERLCSQFVLRLVSCVQLASKLSFHYKIINNVMALHFLQGLGYPYTKEELLESELDVLKSLDFQINLSTPLEYVEMLLEVLGYNGCVVPATQLHATCLTLLDLVYLLHGPVYESLLRAAVGDATPSQLQGEKFCSVEEDFMLLAAGVIAASAFMQNHACWSQVVGHLHSITGITAASIAEFSYAVLTHGVGASTPGQQPVPPGREAWVPGPLLPLPPPPRQAEATDTSGLMS